MKIIILTNHMVYSNILVKKLIKKYPKEVMLIIEPKGIVFNKTYFKTIKKLFKTSGVHYFLVQAIKLTVFKTFSFFYAFLGKDINSKFFGYRKFAQKKSIKIQAVNNINDLQIIREIEKVKPDLLISVLFPQILKPNVIKIPALGCINIHPALLPFYKGTCPVFWALVNEEKYSGVTVHYIDEGIDTGAIIKQKKIKIRPNDTEDTLYWRSVKEGSRLLASVIEEFKKGKVKSFKKSGGSSFSYPTKQAILKYKRMGKSFFRMTEYLFGK